VVSLQRAPIEPSPAARAAGAGSCTPARGGVHAPGARTRAPLSRSRRRPGRRAGRAPGAIRSGGFC